MHSKRFREYINNISFPSFVRFFFHTSFWSTDLSVLNSANPLNLGELEGFSICLLSEDCLSPAFIPLHQLFHNLISATVVNLSSRDGVDGRENLGSFASACQIWVGVVCFPKNLWLFSRSLCSETQISSVEKHEKN